MLKMAFCAFKIFRDNIWKMTPKIWNFPYVSSFFFKASLREDFKRKIWNFLYVALQLDSNVKSLMTTFFGGICFKTQNL